MLKKIKSKKKQLIEKIKRDLINLYCNKDKEDKQIKLNNRQKFNAKPMVRPCVNQRF